MPGLSKVLDRLGDGDDADAGHVAAAVELVLEGLHLTRRIDKETVDGRTVYGLTWACAVTERTGSGTAPGGAGPTRSRRRTTCARSLDEVGQDVLAGGSLREALAGPDAARRRRAARARRAADRVRRMRRAAQRRGDLGGTLDQVRAALDQALAAERETLAGLEGDDARLAEMELATVPDDTAGAVRALDSYDWRSDEARATFEAIKQMLQREVLDAQFAGMKRMLEDGDPEAMQAVKDMLADLNDAARGARPRRGHRRTGSATSWTSTATSSPSSRRTSTSSSTRWPAARRPPTG